jgi:hypothetical protein
VSRLAWRFRGACCKLVSVVADLQRMTHMQDHTQHPPVRTDTPRSLFRSFPSHAHLGSWSGCRGSHQDSSHLRRSLSTTDCRPGFLQCGSMQLAPEGQVRSFDLGRRGVPQRCPVDLEESLGVDFRGALRLRAPPLSTTCSHSVRHRNTSQDDAFRFRSPHNIMEKVSRSVKSGH